MMAAVELIYDSGCPNVVLSRSKLLQAFSALNIKPHWLEWEINDVNAPAYVRQCGSPTILVDGKDVDEVKTSGNTNHCRLYIQSDNTITGVPSIENIINAIQENKYKSKRISDLTDSGLKAATIPAIIFALLPKLICPFCWPLYTGLLGSIGINFINYTPYLFPLLALFLMLTISGLVLGARTRKQYDPVYLGSLSSLLILAGKFLVETNMIIYIGLIGLSIAVMWHFRIKYLFNLNSCSACNNDEAVNK